MKTLLRKFSLSLSISSLIFISSFTQGLADDIEIYNRTQTIPNVLFVIDASGSMNDPAGSGGSSRLDVVKSAFGSILSQPYSLLNVGFMDFRSWTGSGVDLPVADVNQLANNVEPGVTSSTETYAELLTRSTNALSASGDTPTVEALYEAALYFRGAEPHEGDRDDPHTSWNNSTAKYQGGHWTSAGLRTYENGTIVTQNGWWCLNEPWFSGSDYGECGSQSIDTSTCENYTDQRCTGSYVCNGGTTSEGNCPGGWTCSGSLISETHERCRLIEQRLVGSNYVTPIQSACTENYIVLLSDGIPTEDDYWTDQGIKTLTGKSTCDDLGALGITDTTIIDKGACGVDLLKYLNTVDQSSSTAGTNQPGNQFITTHTIGFQLGATSEGKKYLDELAKAGGGNFYNAGDPSSLVTALQNIVGSIAQKPRTIARVANTLDLSNLSQSRNELYMPLFTPEPNQPRWPGNLKGYMLDPISFSVGLDGNATFLANGDFNSATRSFWSITADGGNVGAGGAAGQLNPGTRTVKTDDGPGTSRSFQDLSSSNTTLTSDPALFGLPGTTSTAAMQAHIEWARGVDVDDEDGDGSNTDARNFIGDALHTNPIVANYDGSYTDPALGGPIDRVVYFMTNEGFVHAINVTGNTSTSGGTELFAYMPSELLDNIDPLRRNVGGDPKVYGLDGPLTLHQVGGLINVSGPKYLYFGMRRGGMNYYALNVTDPTSPSLMWVIEGGSGDFQEMGQSWSKPITAKVRHDGMDKLALVIGGGYDTTQDSAATYTADTKGRAVYIVDAETGQKLWSVGTNSISNPSPDLHDLKLAMENGIAGDVSVIDLNNDKVADRLYFGDTGGHVWRVDFHGDLKTGSAGPSNDYSGYLFADLNGSAVNDNRRFFTRPVVALTTNGKLAVTFGSGHRSHPLDPAVEDRFYTIYDPNINAAPSSPPSAVTESNLQNITNFTTGYTDTSKTGWLIQLGTGEKVFNEATIANSQVFFTTYFPPATICNNDPNGAHFFVVDLEGRATQDLDGNPGNGHEAYVTINTHGILPGIELIHTNKETVGVFPPEKKKILPKGGLRDRFWTNTPPP